MQRPGRSTCLLLLASSGLLPSPGLAEDPLAHQEESHLVRLERALSQAERTLSLERFLLRKLEGLDAGYSPSYPAELQAARGRVFEAEAWLRALQRARDELSMLLDPPARGKAGAASLYRPEETPGPGPGPGEGE